MRHSLVLLILSFSIRTAAASHADPPATPAIVAVAVSGVQAGVTVMAYWQAKPLFEKEVPQPASADTPFLFTVEAQPGAGHLKIWSFHKARGGGGAATFRHVALKAGVRYTLHVSPEDGYRLQFTLAEEGR